MGSWNWRRRDLRPAELEILQNAVTFIPEEMGIALRRTAYSPNIKERMDASCALFDAEGRMIAQAEHIPVHLGSMPVTIEVLREEMGGNLAEGDQVIVNDPYRGGSHLPDITLVRPIFHRGSLRGYSEPLATPPSSRSTGSPPSTRSRPRSSHTARGASVRRSG